ncbi:hypothetical protein [Celeribacter indicus]|uniref:Lipoprotein n=1 Tax=Celeribacter indicus TaxID=1208324 RepID=A0A0B5DP40_9RHOB|nr:hypothetical protein [Celeribacter indicus]AJE45348.1 hypothetical protein P73_0633 [Celeribacter indicus]SDW99567.1 hypothetical protein SAMN05443573_1119 [Celeribacter indicus]
MISFARHALSGLSLLALVACGSDAAKVTAETPLVDLGDFRLGHNVVIAKDAQKAPFSREATEEEIETALTATIQERLGRYEGDKLYHIGIKVDAYGLAAPGLPVLFTPKSILVLAVNIWDDSQNRKLTEKPKVIVVFESLTGETVIGSGLTRSREEQLDILTRNAALKVERWLQENGRWFGVEPIAPEGSEADDARAALEVLAPDAVPPAANDN